MDIDIFIPKFHVSSVINGISHYDFSQENIVEQSHHAHNVFDVPEQISDGWECYFQAEISVKSPHDDQEVTKYPSGHLLALSQQEADAMEGPECPNWL